MGRYLPDAEHHDNDPGRFVHPLAGGPRWVRAEVRRFQLHRDQDITGVSGTGIVADGVLFADRSVAIRWRGEHPSTVVWARWG